MPGTIDCTTPKDNLKVIPCLTCLSESQLKQLLIVIMADLFGSYSLPADTAALLQDSVCYTCMSKKQRLQVTVTIWATLAYQERDEEITVEEIREKIKCLLCASPAQVDAMLAQVTCGLINYLQN